MHNPSNTVGTGQLRTWKSIPRSPRVFVAEDEVDVREFVAHALRSLGFDVYEAGTGADLLDLIGSALLDGDPSARPDVIVADVRMPGFTGLEILAGLVGEDWCTSVVLMTAFVDSDVRAEAARLGVTALFEKPFDIDDLLTAVVNMVPSRFGRRVTH